jgi:hypothetical protein
MAAKVTAPDRDRRRLVVQHGGVRRAQTGRIRDCVSAEERAEHGLGTVARFNAVARVDVCLRARKVDVLFPKAGEHGGRVRSAVRRREVDVRRDWVVRVLLDIWLESACERS